MYKIFSTKKTHESLKQKFARGFTLVETLVAISILMISVSGPLYFSAQSLRAATYAKDQITAFFLAQEGFEMIRYVRDNNLLPLSGSSSWLDRGILDNCVGVGVTCRVKPYEIDTDLSKWVNIIEKCTLGDCGNLYIDNTNGEYSYSSTNATLTPFKRTIKIVPNATNDEIKVTVTISWRSGTIDRQFTASEYLRNIGS